MQLIYKTVNFTESDSVVYDFLKNNFHYRLLQDIE